MKQEWQTRGLNRGAKWTASVLLLLLALFSVLMTLWSLQTTRAKTRLARSVATVDGKSISPGDLAEELRARLWRGGETWDTLSAETRIARRDQALEDLIGNRLAAQFAARRRNESPALHHAIEEEFQQFLKQFPPPDEWKERMTLQGFDETTLRKRIDPETRSLDAIESWLAEQPGKITEADARGWFEAHTNEMTLPERVRASHIFLTRHDKDKPDREAEIRELHRRLTAGEATFEALATKNSDDDSARLRAGDLGWFTRTRVPPEFAGKVFGLPVGELSAPFESHLGWHLLIVREKVPQRVASFEESRDEILAMLDLEWRAAAVQRLLENLRSKAKIERFEGRIATISPE